MPSFDYKKLLPHVIAIAAFYLVTALYFYPEVFKGESVTRFDTKQFYGMSKQVEDYKQEQGENPLWNDAMFSGMPNYLISTSIGDQPMPVLAYLSQGLFHYKEGARSAMTLMIGFYILLLTYNVRPYIALFGAVAFAFGSYNMINIEAGHMTKVWAVGYAPYVLAGINLTFRRKYFAGFGLTVLGTFLELRAYHLQITYYLVFVCVIFGISELIFAAREGRLKQFGIAAGILLAAAALAPTTKLTKILLTQEYSEYSIRGKAILQEGNEAVGQGEDGLSKEYAFSWSQGVSETLTLLIPYYYGGGSREPAWEGSQYAAFQRQQGGGATSEIPGYFGDQPFTAGPLYAGAVVCFLFVFGMTILPDRERWWMLSAALLCMFFAWGKNFATFNYFMFDFFPGFNKFRSVSMALSLTMLFLPLVGTLAVERLLVQGFDKSIQTKLLIALGATAGFCLLTGLFASGGDYFSPREQEMLSSNPRVAEVLDLIRQDRVALVRGDAFRSFFLIVLAAGGLYVAATIKEYSTAALLTVGALMAGDVILVSFRYLDYADFAPNASRKDLVAKPVDDQILKDKSHFRVLDTRSRVSPFQSADASYFHNSVGGYFAVKMRRYQDLIERHLSLEHALVQQSIFQDRREPNTAMTPVLNMLNTKYYIYGSKNAFTNSRAQGPAWFVSTVKTFDNADEEVKALAREDLTTTATLDGSRFSIDRTSFNASGTVALTDYDMKALRYEIEAQGEAFVVFSELYYPEGWQATIDGQAADIYCVNYTLRGLKVPAGKHVVEMTFAPATYANGYVFTKIMAVVLFLLIVGSLGYSAYVGIRKAQAEPKKELA